MPIKQSIESSETKRKWFFVLFVAGDAPIMERASNNIRAICSKYLKNEEYHLQTVDVFDEDVEIPIDVIATPTLIRKAPAPERRIIGDLSDFDHAAVYLGLKNSFQ